MSDSRLSIPLQESVGRAVQLATTMKQGMLLPHHLLLAMLQRPDVRAVVGQYVSIEQLSDATVQAALRELPTEVPQSNNLSWSPPLQAQSLGHVLASAYDQRGRNATADHPQVLLAFTLVEQGGVARLLRDHGLDRTAMTQALAHAPPQNIVLGGTSVDFKPQMAPAVEARGALARFAQDLNARARANKMDPVIGRQAELDRIIQVLARRKKNNPLLVGEPGVGKTAVAEGLALRVVQREVPESLLGLELYSLNLATLVAGTKYRGDFEERVQAVLDEVRARPNVVLVVDEIHTIVGAGAASGGSMDAANLFKPALASGDLRVIGATTFKEYRQVFAQDEALSRRFQKVDVLEPTPDEARQILEGARPQFEAHHQVYYTAAALDAAVSLSVRYLPDRQLPDKAIDVMDEVGAQVKLTHTGTATAQVDRVHVERIIAQMARVPVGQVSAGDLEALRTLEADLKAVIFGQDEAVKTLTSAITMSRAGIRGGDRPVANLLFAGPTGVGKTELTRQLAQRLGLPLLRFDMSEYMEAHSISRLVGSPPGYVGYNKGGQLTEQVSQNPHAVVLIDEIEKAHPEIANILLQVMDRGTLTDATGRSIDFRHVILVLTTNAGAFEGTRPSLGFLTQDHRADALKAIEARFPPEFRGRLDEVVQFHNLGTDQVARVVDKGIAEFQALLVPRGVTLTVQPSARQWLAEQGYSPTLGARPMVRLIETSMKRPVADALLFGALAQGGVAEFSLGVSGLDSVFYPHPVLEAEPV